MENTKQIAAYLNVQPATIRKWRLRYGMPAYRIGNGKRGGTVLYNRKEVDKWLEDRRQATDVLI